MKNSLITFYLYFWCTVVVLLAEEGSILKGLHDDALHLAAGVDHAYSFSVFVGIWFKKELMLQEEFSTHCLLIFPNLVYEHSHGYSGHVESVQEVLDGHVCLLVHGVRLLQLQHPLCHGLHHVRVASLYSF